MTLTLELTEEETALLEALAKAQNGDMAQVAHNLLAADLLSASSPVEDQTLALLARWAEEDDTDDTAELRRRDVETAEFMANVEAERLTLALPGV